MNQYVLFGWNLDNLAVGAISKNWPFEYPIEFPIQVTQITQSFYSNVIVGVPINGELVEFSLYWFIHVKKLSNETENN